MKLQSDEIVPLNLEKYPNWKKAQGKARQDLIIKRISYTRQPNVLHKESNVDTETEAMISMDIWKSKFGFVLDLQYKLDTRRCIGQRGADLLNSAPAGHYSWIVSISNPVLWS